eukprot:Filipodium_phascolosomae@DN653_c0_g1_i2.p1
MTENFEARLNEFSGALSALEEVVLPLEEIELSELNGSIDEQERCQLHAMMGFSITSLYFMLLRLDGIDPKQHPILQELDRVKKYTAKLNQAMEDDKEPSRRVDVGAAGRFIAAQLAANPKSPALNDPTNQKRPRAGSTVAQKEEE